MSSGWTDDNETILKVFADKAFLASRYHERLYYMYSGRLKYIKIPIIVISGINSVLAVGLAEYLDQGIISATNSVLALVCGVLGSIELFLKVSDNMVQSLAAARELFILHIEVRKTLKLPRDQRGVDAKSYLDNVYSRYVDIINNSKLIITTQSEHKFEYYRQQTEYTEEDINDMMQNEFDTTDDVADVKASLQTDGVNVSPVDLQEGNIAEKSEPVQETSINISTKDGNTIRSSPSSVEMQALAHESEEDPVMKHSEL